MEPSTASNADRRDGVLGTLFKGGLVGIANIIPGVSGGTFALILGIFDRLIGALNALDAGTVKATLRVFTNRFDARSRGDFISELRRIDAAFLTLLGIGAVVAILSTAFLIDFLLKSHYTPTLAFFVGLILPSIGIPWAMMGNKGPGLLWILPGIALTVGVAQVMPDSSAASDNPLYAALTGAIAISAMILPGLSGSYVMLVMGQYQNVIDKLTGLQRGLAAGSVDLGAVLWLGAFGLGMAVGVVAFARFLHFLLERRRGATMAFLIGLLLGSLWVLWPFKQIDEGAVVAGRSGEVKEEVKIATAPNRMPRDVREGLLGGGALFAGLIVSGGMIAAGRKREKVNS